MSQHSYQLLDSGHYRRLERVGPWVIVRPALAAMWAPSLPESEWRQAHAVFERNAGGQGRWKWHKGSAPESCQVHLGDLQVELRFTDFGHLGIFPEHHDCTHLTKCLREIAQPKVLNLFAYTGYPTLAMAAAGAEVVHVDSSKTSVAWARQNAELSGLKEKPIRWICDDVRKFVAREFKRGQKYHGILLDPPSYGRGKKGEVWKIEDDLLALLRDLMELVDDSFGFLQLSSHSQGHTPMALANTLKGLRKDSWKLNSREMWVPGPENHLPAGACAWLSGDK